MDEEDTKLKGHEVAELIEMITTKLSNLYIGNEDMDGWEKAEYCEVLTKILNKLYWQYADATKK